MDTTAGEIPPVGAVRTAEVVEGVIITAAETAATTIGTIPGIGTAVEEEGTAARITTIARPGTTTTGTRVRTRALDTTSGTIRIRTTGIVARRTGSAHVRTTLRREVAAAEITVPEVMAAIIIVAATEALPVGTMTARHPMTNATAVAEPAPVMITTRHRAAEEQAEVIGLITAAAAEVVEGAESVAVTSLAIRWDHPARWDRQEYRAVARARLEVPEGHGRRCRRI